MNINDWFGTYFYNDINLLPFYALTCVVMLFVLVGAIYLHELGHWLYFKVFLKRNVKIRFVYKNLFSMYFQVGDDADYKDMDNDQYKTMLIFGLISGMLVILISSYIWDMLFLVLIPYMIGSWRDIKNIIENLKDDDIEPLYKGQ